MAIFCHSRDCLARTNIFAARGRSRCATFSIEEKVRFGQLTRIVETNLSSFLAGGKALAEIKNSRLYRERFSSFEE